MANKKRLEVFDPALCCATGVCGTESDQGLVNFAADVEWARAEGGAIERFNLAQQPLAFAERASVKAFLERSGPEGLPLTLIDGEIALAGRYPTRAELGRWLEISVGSSSPSSSSLKTVSGGCSGSGGCC
jgi:hypothetical protein